jgi:hypothetical protein
MACPSCGCPCGQQPCPTCGFPLALGGVRERGSSGERADHLGDDGNLGVELRPLPHLPPHHAAGRQAASPRG